MNNTRGTLVWKREGNWRVGFSGSTKSERFTMVEKSLEGREGGRF
jgi:hypothetical protein